MTIKQDQPNLYLSMPHACGYLPGRVATTLFVDPRYPLSKTLYTKLVSQGFRRSGDLVYRPRCESCPACVPVRIPVSRFRPSRGQRRTWNKNQDIAVRTTPAGFRQEHFDLYCRYQRVRHQGGSMDNADPNQYRNFLISPHVEACFYEFRLNAEKNGKLLAVAVADRLLDGLSAVYTFFDPQERHRSLGVYALLWEIEEAKRLGLSYLYLGYWIAECQKMAYKTDYHALEAYRAGYWSLLET